MTDRAQELLRAALALAPEERADVAAELLASLDERAELIDSLIEEGLPPLTDEQKVSLDRRWEAYKANPDDVFPAETVHAELMARRS